MPSHLYPRILFVTSHAFNHVSGGGITFSNLFRGWPSDCLATVHNDPEPISDDVCSRYYALGSNEIDLIFPFNRLRQKNGRLAGQETYAAPASPTPGRTSVLRWLALNILGDRLPERATLTPALEKWVAEFKPDLLYTILGTGGLMDLIETIRLRFDLPLAVHVMDDWLGTHGKGLLGRREFRRMTRQAERFFNVASLRMGISPSMCAAYNQRYGVSFQAFQNTIDVMKWSALSRPASEAGTPADIIYVGSIFPNAQLDSLIDTCNAVARLNEEGDRATLTIVSPVAQVSRYRARLTVHPSIRIVDTIRDDQAFFERITAADMLLLPVNFDQDTQTYIRYSMPTKVPAYLASGTPILAYGPPGVAQIDYAREDDWALVVERQGVEGLAVAMQELIENVQLRQRLSANAKNCAAQNNDSALVRREFQAALCSAAGDYSRKVTP